MVNAKTLGLVEHLREAVNDFLSRHSPWLPAVAEALRGLRREPQVALFGGLLRDLVVFGRDARPRDVDLVVGGVTGEELAAAFHPYTQRATRFGGLQLRVEGVEIDLWPLEATWAFRTHRFSPPSFSELPRTTFLNVEAVAVVVQLGKDGAAGRVHDAGFFDAVAERRIEINFEDNPRPDLCLARSLDLAARLGYSIGPRLAGFAARWLAQLGEAGFAAAHRAAHGSSACPACLFRAWHQAIVSLPPGSIVPAPAPSQLPAVATPTSA